MASKKANAKKSTVKTKHKKKIKDMNVDEFFSAELSTDSESSSMKSLDPDVDSSDKVQNLKGVKPTKHKDGRSLAETLFQNDPEFYEFLKNEDETLLQNLDSVSDSEGNSDVEDGLVGEFSEASPSSVQSKTQPRKNKKSTEHMIQKENDDSSEDEDTVHKIPSKLEVASDDSEDESESEEKHRKGITVVNNKLLNNLSTVLRTKPTFFAFKDTVLIFNAAVHEASGIKAQENKIKYKVEGSTTFNNVIRLCLTYVAPALEKMFGIPSLSDTQTVLKSSSKMWKKSKSTVKAYLKDLLTLLSQLSESEMVNAVMKHTHKLVVFYANLPKLVHVFLKRMIKLWSSSEETTRVLAFLCINKLLRLKQEDALESCIKQMYGSYVSSCKFTSPTTLPVINFMRKCLVEIFNINKALAYQYAFIYIRQMAIHLRNAITLKKKNNIEAVYNWQYVHCLNLWIELLSSTHPCEVLNPLIYPMTQTIIGTIKLVPTAKYFPLRFHLVKFLNILGASTETFIPTIPFLLDVFEMVDFNKRHKSVSLKPFNFSILLKFSNSQLNEKAFKDGIVDQLYEHLLESFNVHAHSVGFPELIIPSVLQMKNFVKKCKIANYCKQIKQIIDKIEEQAKVIVEKRKQSSLDLQDFSAISRWENELQAKGTPLRRYYSSWRKLRDRELLFEQSNKEAISGAAFEVPVINRKPQMKATEQDRQDFSKLFENDSDSDDETRFLIREERGEKNGKVKEAESDSEGYSDFDDEELEQLAQSASSDNEENEDIDADADESSGNKSSDELNDIVEETVKKQRKRKFDSTPSPNNKSKRFKKEVEEEFERDLVEDFVLSDSE